jgi:hypothetical protein
VTRKKLYAVPGGLWWASDNSFAHRAFPASIFENRVRATSIHLPKPLWEAVSALTKGEQRILTLLSHIAKNELGIPQPVVAKIASGIERLPRSKRRETFKCSSS